jgi:NADH-quinone oxidoreductase subunit C
MSERLEKVMAVIGDAGIGSVECSMAHGELAIHVVAEDILATLELLRDHDAILCTQLVDICAVDYPQNPERFEIVYNLLSVKRNLRVRVKLQTSDEKPVPSAMELFPAANWYEREVWDMYGVFFSDHPDLRRILTDYGFDGHPQRKDFPLTGFVELRYDETQKKVVYEPVKLQQAYRSFDYSSPWEGARYDAKKPADA